MKISRKKSKIEALQRMLSYCLKCRKNRESKNQKVVKTKKIEK